MENQRFSLLFDYSIRSNCAIEIPPLLEVFLCTFVILTATGRGYLSSRIKHAEDTGEAITIDMFGTKRKFGGIDPKILIADGLAAVVIIGLLLTRKK